MYSIFLITNFTLKFLSNEIRLFDNFNIEKIKVTVEPCDTKKCTIFSCRKINFIKDSVNLKDLVECKTHCKNGSEIWKNITDICNIKNDKFLVYLISGLHFAINLHIAYNYYNLYFFYYHNINVYLRQRKYFHNFMLLLLFIRKKIKFYAENKQINYKIDQEETNYINKLKQSIKEIGCLDCEKCQILGTLHFQGLINCIKVDKPSDLIYVVFVYKKLLKTLKVVYFFENIIQNN